MKHLWPHFIFSVFLLPAPALHADENSPRQAYWYISAGDFKADETPAQLENEGSSFGLSVGAGLRPWRYVALEGEIAMLTAKYDAPPLSVSPGGSIDARMRVTSAGLVGNAKIFYDFARGRVYAGAGLGVFGAEAEITGTVFGFPAVRVEDDTVMGYRLLVGGDLAVARSSYIGFEYRRHYLEADFGELSQGKVDIGGDYLGVNFRQAF